jgi:hypothetical protein
MDPDTDSDPAIFVIDLQDANKKLFFSFKVFCLLKKSQSSRNQGFSYGFCLVIEGSATLAPKMEKVSDCRHQQLTTYSR